MPISKVSKAIITELASEFGEIYQDVEVKGKLVLKGVRDCEDRWEMIKYLIDPNSVVLDLGSSYGYFARKIATEIPGTLVLSFERDKKSAYLQRELLRQENITNVILLHSDLSFESLLRWVKTVEAIDTVLALSVLHNYEPEKIKNVIKLFNSFARHIILEMPNEKETNAVGHDTVMALSPLEKTLRSIYPVANKIGEVKSHVQDVNRLMYI